MSEHGRNICSKEQKSQRKQNDDGEKEWMRSICSQQMDP